MMPLAADRVDWEEVGMFFHQGRHLPLGEFQGFCVSIDSRIGHGSIPPKVQQ
jgi:hypothetical protein